MNRLLVGAGTVLILLIAITLFITNFTKQKTVSETTVVTPIPTVGFEAKPGATFYNNTWEKHYQPVDTNFLSDKDQQALDNLKNKLPFENDKFAIDYSPFLNQFFLDKKTPDADEALNAFLNENDASGLQDKLTDLFTVVNESPRIAILKAEGRVTNKLQEEGGIDESGSTPKTPQEIDVEVFADLATILTNFDIPTGLPQAPQGKVGGGSASCTNASGNVKIACEALNLLGFPYANGTEGIPVRFAAHPPGPWVDARNAGDGRFKYLDCSGLTSVAVYKAFGTQNPGLHGRNYCSATYLNDKANFRRLGSLREIKPGDLVIKGTSCGNKGHVAVVVSYDGNNTMEVAEAYSHKAPSARRTHRLNSGSFNFAVRYIGPGATP